MGFRVMVKEKPSCLTVARSLGFTEHVKFSVAGRHEITSGEDRVNACVESGLEGLSRSSLGGYSHNPGGVSMADLSPCKQGLPWWLFID